MVNKGSKVRIIESFYGLDYVFFGAPIKEKNFKCTGLVEDYLAIKGAILSTLLEIFSLIDHSPEFVSESLNFNNIRKMAKSSAVLARENCQRLVVTEGARKDIKFDLRESLERNPNVDINKFVHEVIREKAFNLAVDNLLVARSLTESKKIQNLNDWTGKIVEDAYKILRKSLVESALKLIYECEVNESCSKKKNKMKK